MATAPTIVETARQKLERLRVAARKLQYESWGNVEEMRQEALQVHEAYKDSRDRANELG
jgi:hypothetical protein